jgi:hypothetical protein
MSITQTIKKTYKPKSHFFKSPRLEIGRILIEELTYWKSADKPTEEEFYRLVERLHKIICPTYKKQ